jgi:predicted aldo/keto reductase-like oxidoreductase
MHPFLTRGESAFGKQVCRLGLAARGGSRLVADDLLAAVERGVNFLNWPARSEGPREAEEFGAAIASLGPLRENVVVCIQLAARGAKQAADELRWVLKTLQTDYVDVATFYYVEHVEEWNAIIAPGGAMEYCRAAKADGLVRRIGLTSHQRPLAAEMAASGLLDALMIRYNAAHRGAEQDIFPVTDARSIPVIAYTALRWRALLRPTPDDPPGFEVPCAVGWYRFVLESDSVAVVLAAPNDRAELLEDLEMLTVAGPLEPAEYERLADHGARVRRHAGAFP